MGDFLSQELERLNAGFAEETGRPFLHFFCPILFVDEPTALCRAHIINAAFPDSARDCTVQRADVDSFFGSRFEADFVDIAHYKRKTLEEIVANSSLSRRFNATVLLNGNSVEHFQTGKNKPDQYSVIQLGKQSSSESLGLKMTPAEVVERVGENWEIEISRDLRLPMLVSTIKAAHLTLFKLLGYPYALSAAGEFVGHQILGKFYLLHHHESKKEVTEHALDHFAGFVHMVRPILSTTIPLEGTVSDNMLFLCMGSSGVPWASIVLVRTMDQLHGVLIPSFQGIDQSDAFFGFLGNSNSSIQVSTCRHTRDSWEISPCTTEMRWPKDGALLL